MSAFHPEISLNQWHTPWLDDTVWRRAAAAVTISHLFSEIPADTAFPTCIHARIFKIYGKRRYGAAFLRLDFSPYREKIAIIEGAINIFGVFWKMWRIVSHDILAPYVQSLFSGLFSGKVWEGWGGNSTFLRWQLGAKWSSFPPFFSPRGLWIGMKFLISPPTPPPTSCHFPYNTYGSFPYFLPFSFPHPHSPCFPSQPTRPDRKIIFWNIASGGREEGKRGGVTLLFLLLLYIPLYFAEVGKSRFVFSLLWKKFVMEKEILNFRF